MDERPQLFKMSEDDVNAIRAALIECDSPDWSLRVRIGDSWDSEEKQAIELLDNHSVSCREGVEGYQLGLFLHPDATVLGDLKAVEDVCGFSHFDNIGLHNGTSRLTDLSPLGRLEMLRSARVSNCRALEDISPLSALKEVRTLDLSGCRALSDLSPLAELKELRILDLQFCNPTEISALQTNSKLRWLRLSGCRRIGDYSPLGGLTELETLMGEIDDMSVFRELTNLENLFIETRGTTPDLACLRRLVKLSALRIWVPRARRGTPKAPLASLVDLSDLESLTELHEFSLVNCSSLSDISGLSHLTELRHLSLFGIMAAGCDHLTDISPLKALTELRTLDLHSCSALEDLSGLEGLRHLTEMDLSQTAVNDLSPLGDLTELQSLKLEKCGSLNSLAGLQELTKLRRLELGSCSALTDLSALQRLTEIRALDLSSCSALTDLSGVQGLTELRTLDLSSCSALTDLSHLEGLTRTQSLNLGKCTALTNLVPLQGWNELRTLVLSSCLTLNDLSPLRDLSALEHLDVTNCPDLTDPDRWVPIESLKKLRTLIGSFPTYFVARLLARNAADAGDLEFVRSNLAEWVEVAQRSPESPGLLSAVGRAAALEPEGYPALVELIALATTHEVADVDGFFAAACGLGEIESVEGALSAAVEQATSPLPAESLVALHRHRPHDTTLRDRTLLALQRSLASADAPDWCARTAQALYEALSDPRYPLDTAVHETVANALTGRQFTAIEQALYGALSSDHAQAADSNWRDEFHATLLALGLVQTDAESRNQALSALASGLAQAGDWGADRLDALLRAAAQVDADTSALQAAAARAHAAGDRWSAAEDALFAIARPAVRDECIRDLLSLVLASEGADRAQRAVGFVAGLSDPWDRAEQLVSLGKSGQLLSDPIAYGHLIALLAEHPDAQLEVVTAAVKAQPALANVQTSSSFGAVTAREQRLVTAWRAAVTAVAPELLDAIERQLSQEPG